MERIVDGMKLHKENILEILQYSLYFAIICSNDVKNWKNIPMRTCNLFYPDKIF
jgi:hypothetical protein